MQAALVDSGGELPRLLDRVSAHGVELTQILLSDTMIQCTGC